MHVCLRKICVIVLNACLEEIDIFPQAFLACAQNLHCLAQRITVEESRGEHTTTLLNCWKFVTRFPYHFLSQLGEILRASLEEHVHHDRVSRVRRGVQRCALPKTSKRSGSCALVHGVPSLE